MSRRWGKDDGRESVPARAIVMLGLFLDRLSGFFDRRFMVAYWAPAFLAFGLTGLIDAAHVGLPVVENWWINVSILEQSWLAVALLFIITVLAYLLQALTGPLVRLYEGYLLPKRLAEWARSGQQMTYRRLHDTTDYHDREHALRELHNPSDYRTLFYNFPRNGDLLRPTRLGNALTAAEEYPYQMYELDGVLWWPRLAPLLPDSFSEQVDAALTPMLTFLNLSALLTVLGAGGGGVLALTDRQWWLFTVVFVGGLGLASACYRAAVSQAMSYGNLLRVAFDLYRHDILKQMHLPIPDNLRDERILWDALNQWIYRYTPPWDTRPATDTSPAPPDPCYDPFYYDTHTEPSEQEQRETQVLIGNLPVLTVRHGEVDHV